MSNMNSVSFVDTMYWQRHAVTWLDTCKDDECGSQSNFILSQNIFTYGAIVQSEFILYPNDRQWENTRRMFFLSPVYLLSQAYGNLCFHFFRMINLELGRQVWANSWSIFAASLPFSAASSSSPTSFDLACLTCFPFVYFVENRRITRIF